MSLLLPFVLIGCAPTSQAPDLPPPPIQSDETEPLGLEEVAPSGETLTLEQLREGLEPGIVLTNDPWDPWNDISLTWAEIFSEESRIHPAQPYVARNMSATTFQQQPAGLAGTIGLVDPTSFCANDAKVCNGEDAGGNGAGHGHRMALNVLEAYPEAGVQAVTTDAYFVPLFGEVDGRYQRMGAQLGVDYLSNPILLAFSAFALQSSDRAKVLVAATNRRWEFNDTDGLWNGYPYGDTQEAREVAKSQGPAWEAGYEWLLRGDDESVVDTEYGPWAISTSSLAWAEWWSDNQDRTNTLLVKTNSNYFSDDQGVMVDCFPQTGGLTADFDPICGVTDTAMAVTGVGLETVLFVCHYDPAQNLAVGNHSGPFAENTIYAYGAVHGDTKSCSQTAPIVGAAAQQIADTNPSLTAAEIKVVLMETASQVAAKRLLRVEPNTYSTNTIRVLDVDAAISCARDLNCLN